jgi:hypothetical protein
VAQAVFEKTVTFILLAAVGIVIARNAYGKRHWLMWHVARFILFFLAVLVVGFLLHASALRGWWVFYVAVGLASPVYSAWQWKRSRWIPRAKYRKTIERWEARTGKHFDSKIYEVDHKLPFSKGGWHTMDNLRVVR